MPVSAMVVPCTATYFTQRTHTNVAKTSGEFGNLLLSVFFPTLLEERIGSSSIRLPHCLLLTNMLLTVYCFNFFLVVQEISGPLFVVPAVRLR